MTTRFDRFVELLAQLPPEVWRNAVTGAGGWRWMQPFSEAWQFGHFSALFIMLGLNLYQPKGKGDVGYWPYVVPLISKEAEPEDPRQLIPILQPFYERERFSTNKLKRLNRFLTSDLCHDIWESEPEAIAADFGGIWKRLARTMKQRPVKKTIVYAMKCLAFALLMVDKTDFDFSAIPLPVDSRIRKISERLGTPSQDDDVERQRWQEVLQKIRRVHPKVTMIHLDSVLWQIGTQSPSGIESHLRKLGAGDLATPIAKLFE